MKIIKNKYGEFIEPDYKVIDKDVLSCATSEVRYDWYEFTFKAVSAGLAGIILGLAYSYYVYGDRLWNFS